MKHTRNTKAAAAVIVAAALVSSCAANPGPPPLVEPQDQPTTTTSQTATTAAGAEGEDDSGTRTQLQVGIDPVRAGFNPHLASDASAVVDAIAERTLPSAFRDGVRDEDLLVGASRLPGGQAPFRVRYVIAPEAQWSDGTPVTGRDFVYLWRGMTTTPGVLEPAGYRAIERIRVSGPGGNTVDVDFAQPVAEWKALFSNLLPSHLLAADASDFSYALRNTIPASAGRFLMAEADRVRGTITLNRNDRYWGAHPSEVDILTLSALRDTAQAADQLRSGQLAYAEFMPHDTTAEVLGLVQGVSSRTFTTPRTLGVVLSASGGMSAQVRRQARSLIDVPLLAHIASERTQNIAVAPHAYPPVDGVEELRAFATRRGALRVAADATDPAASAAAKSLVDLFNRVGVSARLVATELAAIAGRGLPENEVDLVVAWQVDTPSATAAAGRLACPPEGVRSGNYSGFCSAGNDELARQVLAGEVPVAHAREAVAKLEADEALWVPLMFETRIAASSEAGDKVDPRTF